MGNRVYFCSRRSLHRSLYAPYRGHPDKCVTGSAVKYH
nr:MAG TPA: hypothetical protein [Caudoviricetes sp.]